MMTTIKKNIKLKKTKFIFIMIALLNITTVFAQQEKEILIYFYSSTCGSCSKVDVYLKDIERNYNIEIKKLNILDLSNKELLNRYNEVYVVPELHEGMIPAIFFRDKYFIGERDIFENIEEEIHSENKAETKIISEGEYGFNNEETAFKSMNVLSVILAGLINGLNPCSISMLLFFISLIKMRKKHLIKIGLGFCVGKYITYLLLGTVLFNVLSNIELGWISKLVKVIFLILIILLILLNLNDFIASKKESYDKIKLQLPTRLRKINHKIMKKISGINNIKVMILISFLLGGAISVGEFLCTGQIYLATIVTILQTSSSYVNQALIYLAIYNIGLITPLVILVVLVYKGKEIFDISEAIRERMHIIKIINIILFIVFGIIILMSF